MAFLAAGSSPLTRGKPWAAIVDAWNAGLIPAHAGKTTGVEVGGEASGAHPRSRGENRGSRPIVLLLLGSSPLTRGKQARGLPPLGAVGLIPAHAGKTYRTR